jgi:hypothetical protein
MSQKTAAHFCKRGVCPTAETLLGFHRAELSATKARCVSEHLTECEFCCAEFDFLTAYPPNEEKITNAEMPSALRDLAEALLGGRQGEFRLLDKMLDAKNF